MKGKINMSMTGGALERQTKRLGKCSVASGLYLVFSHFFLECANRRFAPNRTLAFSSLVVL
jgi:hypothetical protein